MPAAWIIFYLLKQQGVFSFWNWIVAPNFMFSCFCPFLPHVFVNFALFFASCLRKPYTQSTELKDTNKICTGSIKAEEMVALTQPATWSMISREIMAVLLLLALLSSILGFDSLFSIWTCVYIGESIWAKFVLSASILLINTRPGLKVKFRFIRKKPSSTSVPSLTIQVNLISHIIIHFPFEILNL